MATESSFTCIEGQSIDRPPFFDGNDYSYWKNRMRIYLQSLDYDLWEIVCENQNHKLSSKWNEMDKRKCTLNAKAMNSLYCALDRKEFNRISDCKNAYDIWRRLEIVYEETSQVNVSKINEMTRPKSPLLLNSKSIEKKAMMATWDDSDDSSNEEEFVNLAYMALEDKEIEEHDEVSDQPSYDELYNALHELHDDFKKVVLKNTSLKKKIASMSNDYDILQKQYDVLKNENDSMKEQLDSFKLETKILHEESSPSDIIILKEQHEFLKNDNDSLREKLGCLHDEIALLNNRPSSSNVCVNSNVDVIIEENEALKKKSNELNDIVLKFTNGQKNLEMLLGSQKCVFDKCGLGYKSNIKQKFYKSYFVKATSNNESKITCNYCNGFGHLSYACLIRKNAYFGGKQIWVPKGTNTNIQGPKKIWVPKSTT